MDVVLVLILHKFSCLVKYEQVKMMLKVQHICSKIIIIIIIIII